ncbi:hypothetical protein V500_01802 [Pseudogymnoascus sp. VKM F-4518 (FW-2643)]|nr:hypothetical protein V500_01802 [Pseudogymnoascus sp. VKM F-4518 (FW-2643)]
MPQNQAAWIPSAGVYPFVIDKAPLPRPGPGQLVIKNAAMAINPVDWKIQKHGRYLNTYPFILGTDTAGVVEDVGPGITRFIKGQRVIAHCNALMTGNSDNAAFQLYTVANERLTAELPDTLSFEEGSVLPLALSTASSGLYQRDFLDLPLPTAGDAKLINKTLLIWGGASSVGASAIQLAVASGLTVVTTASPANQDFVKSLGAHVVVDYRSSSSIEDLVKALRGTDFVGVYDAISEDSSIEAIRKIIENLDVTVKIASVLPYDKPTERFAPRFINAFAIIQEPNQHIGERVWGQFVPQALASRQLKPLPKASIVGYGLGEIQHAVDIQAAGVSAKKIVVTLDIATVDDGASAEALVLTGAERAIGYRYGHRVLLRRAVGGLLTRFAAKIEWDHPRPRSQAQLATAIATAI